jgi:BON domain
MEVKVRRLLSRFPIAFALGAATAFFLDPRDGARRRHELRDRTLRLLRRTGGLLVGKSKFYGGRVKGVAHEVKTAASGEPEAADDATVRQRILSDALRDVGVATKDVDVDVRNGVATIRGEVASSSLADDLVARVRNVPGVRGVTPALTVATTGETLDQGV